MKKTLLSLLIIPSVIFSGERLTRINKSSVLSAERLGLYHDGEAFKVKQNGRIHNIERYDLDANMRQVNAKNLAAYLQSGKIQVNKLSNGDFTLRSHVPGLGGGPISGMIGAWLVRAAMYVPAVTATTGAVVVAGPVGVAATASTAGGYIATTEGFATAVAITLYACPWLP
jgi:formylmethanofuran dehydrogenase subunit C